MTETESLMSAEEMQKFSEFKRKLNREAAMAQVAKIEYDLTDVTVDKGMLKRACQEANLLKLGGICVLPCFVKTCVNYLGSDPQSALIACISFPHGGDTTKIKVAAVKNAVKEGVDEVEVTAPVAYMKDGNWSYVRREFKKLKSAAKKRNVRINIESQLLSPQEIIKVCSIAADCGITSVRSSSGIFRSAFEPETLKRMRSAVKDKCTIKADGVTTISDMNIAVDMGAGIIGSKSAVELSRLILKASEE